MELAAFHAASVDVSLDMPMGSDGEGNLYDVLADDEETTNPAAIAYRLEVTERIAEILRTETAISNKSFFTEKERKVIAMRFGLLGFDDEMTLEEVGDKMGVTRERVRQVEQKALRKLRKILHQKGVSSVSAL